MHGAADGESAPQPSSTVCACALPAAKASTSADSASIPRPMARCYVASGAPRRGSPAPRSLRACVADVVRWPRGRGARTRRPSACSAPACGAGAHPSVAWPRARTARPCAHRARRDGPRAGRAGTADAPSGRLLGRPLDVLANPVRVGHDLVAVHQHWNPALPGQLVDLVTVALADRDPHLVELDAG